MTFATGCVSLVTAGDIDIGRVSINSDHRPGRGRDGADMRGQEILGEAIGGVRTRYRELRHLQGDALIDDTIEFRDPVVVRAYRGWLAPIVRLRRRHDNGGDQIAA